MKIKNLGLYITIGATFLIVALPISKNAKLIILFGAFAGFLFYRRGVIYYSKANKKLQNGALDEAWVLYRKALRAGCCNLRVGIASIFIQQGDVDEGKSILESTKTSRRDGQELDAIVEILFSIQWIEGDENALVRFEVYEAGFKNSNLMVNYHLRPVGLMEAEKLLDEADEKGMNGPGRLTTGHGWRRQSSGLKRNCFSLT